MCHLPLPVSRDQWLLHEEDNEKECFLQVQPVILELIALIVFISTVLPDKETWRFSFCSTGLSTIHALNQSLVQSYFIASPRVIACDLAVGNINLHSTIFTQPTSPLVR